MRAAVYGDVAAAEKSLSRLCLVTPSSIAVEEFESILDDALSGGAVASLIITADSDELADIATALVPIAHAHGVAALIHNETRIAEHTGADGVHIDSSSANIATIVSALQPTKVAGIGGLRSRHDAMLAGELDPDYVFFGRLDGDTEPAIFSKALDLAEWWAGLSQVPAIVMGGASLSSVTEAREAEIEFVALRNAVWNHPSGAREAVSEASRLLSLAKELVP